MRDDERAARGARGHDAVRRGRAYALLLAAAIVASGACSCGGGRRTARVSAAGLGASPLSSPALRYIHGTAPMVVVLAHPRALTGVLDLAESAEPSPAPAPPSVPPDATAGGGDESDARAAQAGLAVAARALLSAVLGAGEMRELGAGLDLERPAGVALLDLTAETAVAFAAVSDGARILRSAREQLGGAVETAVGDGRIVTARGETRAIVLRDGHAFFVVSGARSALELAAVRIAGGAPRDSLAHNRGFARVAAPLDGRDAALYADLRPWAARAVGEAGARVDAARELAALAARRVSEARTRGASQGELAPLAAAMRHHAAALEAERRIAAARVRLMGELVGGVERLGLGVSSDGPAIRLSVVALLRPGSLAARWLDAGDAAGSDAGPVLRAVTAASSLELAVAARTRPDASREVMALLATALGERARPGHDGRSLAIALVGAPLYLGVSGQALVATADRPSFEQLLSGADESGAAARDDAPLVVARADGIAVARLLRYAAGDFAARACAGLCGGWLADRPADTAAFEPADLDDDNDDVPLSDDYRRAADAVRAAEREVEAALSALAAHDASRLGVLAAGVRGLDVAGRREGDTLIAAGRVELAAPELGAAVTAIARAATRHAQARRELAEAVTAALGGVDAARRELVRIRARDVEAWDRGQGAAP